MNKIHTFARNGYATCSDVQTADWKSLFTLLEYDQNIFLDKKSLFRSPKYKWPDDPLHTWSRVWEYPYSYFHLKNQKSNYLKSYIPTVVDFGSGVTFFPFTVARLGYKVICTDTDPLCNQEFSKAIHVISSKPGSVSFQLISQNKLSIEKDSVDIVYCISVLEHVPDFEKTIKEIIRILKPGGMLVLTIDIDLKGNAEIGIEKHKSLISLLKKYFTYAYPESVSHPADLLTSLNGPYPRFKQTVFWWVRRFIKHKIFAFILGSNSDSFDPPHLAVQGLTLTKKK